MKSLMTVMMLILVSASPSMAGDLKAELLDMEKSAWTAWGKHDAKAYAEFMSEDAVMAVAGDEVTRGRDKIAADVGSSTCELKSFDFHDTNLRQLGSDAAIVSYTATQDASCEGQKLPAKLYATAVYVKQDGKWRWVSYQETPLE